MPRPQGRANAQIDVYRRDGEPEAAFEVALVQSSRCWQCCDSMASGWGPDSLSRAAAAGGERTVLRWPRDDALATTPSQSPGNPPLGLAARFQALHLPSVRIQDVEPLSPSGQPLAVYTRQPLLDTKHGRINDCACCTVRDKSICNIKQPHLY